MALSLIGGLGMGALATGAAALGTGALAYGASSLLSPDAPEYPGQIDPGQSALDYITAMADPELQKKLYDSRAQFDPLHQKLDLASTERQIFGMGDQAGSLDILGRIAPEVSRIQSEALSDQRLSDIEDVEALGARATEAMRASDPEMQKLLGYQTDLTKQAYERAQGVTPQQQRGAEQQARAASMSRGRGYDESSVAGEILGRENVLRGNRAEAMQTGAQTFGMLKATGADPFQAILGRPGTAYQGSVGQQGLGFGTAEDTGDMFDPATGINLALQNQSNLANYNASIYGSDANMFGGMMSGAGSLLGGIFG